ARPTGGVQARWWKSERSGARRSRTCRDHNDVVHLTPVFRFRSSPELAARFCGELETKGDTGLIELRVAGPHCPHSRPGGGHFGIGSSGPPATCVCAGRATPLCADRGSRLAVSVRLRSPCPPEPCPPEPCPPEPRTGQ